MFKTENKFWFENINLDDERNRQYVERLLNKFGIINYNYITNNGVLGLVFLYELNSYRCEVHIDEMAVVLLKKNCCGDKSKDKYHFVKSVHNDCWYEILRFVTTRNQRS